MKQLTEEQAVQVRASLKRWKRAKAIAVALNRPTVVKRSPHKVRGNVLYVDFSGKMPKTK